MRQIALANFLVVIVLTILCIGSVFCGRLETSPHDLNRLGISQCESKLCVLDVQPGGLWEDTKAILSQKNLEIQTDENSLTINQPEFSISFWHLQNEKTNIRVQAAYKHSLLTVGELL